MAAGQPSPGSTLKLSIHPSALPARLHFYIHHYETSLRRVVYASPVAMSGPPPPPSSGMSLYANLLGTSSDSSAAASISRAPVAFNPSGDKDDPSKKPLDPGATYSMLAYTTPYTLG